MEKKEEKYQAPIANSKAKKQKVIFSVIILLILACVSVWYFLFNNKSTNNATDKQVVDQVDNSIDLKKLVGTWKSLTTNDEIIFSQRDTEVLIAGSHFPGIAENGDKVSISICKSCKNTKDRIDVLYEFSRKIGGGGGGIELDYYPGKDHFVKVTEPSLCLIGKSAIIKWSLPG